MPNLWENQYSISGSYGENKMTTSRSNVDYVYRIFDNKHQTFIHRYGGGTIYVNRGAAVRYAARLNRVHETTRFVVKEY